TSPHGPDERSTWSTGRSTTARWPAWLPRRPDRADPGLPERVDDPDVRVEVHGNARLDIGGDGGRGAGRQGLAAVREGEAGPAGPVGQRRAERHRRGRGPD